LLYSNDDTFSFEDFKASLLSKEKFDLEVRSYNKVERLSVRGRTFEKEGISRENSHSKSRDLDTKYYRLKNKEDEKNKQSQKSVESSIIDSE